MGLAWKLLRAMANLYQGCAANPKAGLLGSLQLRAIKRLRPRPAGTRCKHTRNQIGSVNVHTSTSVRIHQAAIGYEHSWY